jgi:prepilin-type N-terminal cleavage/methylation domain-containing protein
MYRRHPEQGDPDLVTETRMSSGARRRARSGGFTMVELLMAIAISSGFAIGLYAFFFTGIDANRTHQSQSQAQDGLRRTMETFTRDVRQAVSPDDGINGGIMSFSATKIVMHVDPNRDPSATFPKPLRVTYELAGGRLERRTQQPIGSIPPFSYGVPSAPEVFVDSIQNGAKPIFEAFTEQNVNLGSPVTQPRDIKTIRVTLVAGQKTGNTPTTTELTTDVTLRNTLRY